MKRARGALAVEDLPPSSEDEEDLRKEEALEEDEEEDAFSDDVPGGPPWSPTPPPKRSAKTFPQLQNLQTNINFGALLTHLNTVS